MILGQGSLAIQLGLPPCLQYIHILPVGGSRRSQILLKTSSLDFTLGYRMENRYPLLFPDFLISEDAWLKDQGMS